MAELPAADMLELLPRRDRAFGLPLRRGGHGLPVLETVAARTEEQRMRELITSRGRNYAGSPGCFLKLSSSSLTTATETKADSLSVLLARARGIPCTFEDPASPGTKVFVAVQEAPRCTAVKHSAVNVACIFSEPQQATLSFS